MEKTKQMFPLIPTPWSYDEEEDQVVDADGALIADLYDWDAKLGAFVASVSDMYEALDKIHNWLVCAPVTSAEDMAQLFQEMETTARAALDKAEGRLS